MEQRHDWAKMTFTPELFKYVLFNLIPEVVVHSQSQDEEQVREHYDRKYLSVTFNGLVINFFGSQVATTSTNGKQIGASYSSSLTILSGFSVHG
jgi:hypothetical protein